MTYTISCPMWSSVYECQRVKWAFTYPVRTGCGMVYVRVNCSAWMCSLEEVDHIYIYVCNSDEFIIVNTYLDHLKCCVEGMYVVVHVMVSLTSAMRLPPVFSLGK